MFAFAAIILQQLIAHPDVEPLLQWIMRYFSGGEPRRHSTSTTVGERLLGARAVIVTDRPPIILQHNGHSRTIVGVEQAKDGVINLLTFDPGRWMLRTPTVSIFADESE